MSNLFRLVYTSFKKPICDDGEVKKILEACEENNLKKEITGILLHSDSRFIQYLEGPEKEVLSLFELIQEDYRHTSIKLRSVGEIENRLFPSWAMGFKDLSTKELAFDSEVLESHKKLFEDLFQGQVDFSNDGVTTLQLFFKID